MSRKQASKASDFQNQMMGYISSLEFDSSRSQFLMRAICLNFFVLFCRPQDWPGLSVLGQARVPLMISVAVIFIWLPLYNKSIHKITKYMMFFLVFEMARGVIGKFFDPNDTIVRNDFKQFHTFKDLFLQFMSLSFPLAAVMRSEKGMRKIVFTCFVSGILLGVYAITHAGKGPGGFLGDENDACLVMVMLLPFCVMLRTTFNGSLFRFMALVGAIILCGGIVATNSRGGFLGFAAVLGLFFLRSDKKALTLIGGMAALLIALPFVPQEYIKEITSIRTEVKSGGGTIQERLDTWEVATRVFVDPRNIVFGVGLNNVPHWFGEYEDTERGRYVKSLSGRAMHSIYFSLLPDLGLYGVIVICSIWFYCIRGNFLALRKYERFASLMNRLSVLSGDVAKTAEDDPKEEYRIFGQRLLRQCRIGRDFTRCLNVAWIGTLVAGIGVSALYYPPIWFLAGCSVAMQLHVVVLTRASLTLLEEVEATE